MRRSPWIGWVAGALAEDTELKTTYVQNREMSVYGTSLPLKTPINISL